MHRSRAVVWLFTLSLFSVFLGGCEEHREIRAMVAQFTESMEKGTKATAGYYANLNAISLDAYLEEALTDPEKELLTEDEHGVQTALSQPTFDPKALSIRMKVLKVVGRYGTLIGQIAGSDAPTKFRTNVAAFQGSLTGLYAELEDDADARNKFGASVGLLGKIAGHWMDQKRFNALKRGINQAKEPVETLLTELRDDFKSTEETGSPNGEIEVWAATMLDTRYSKLREFYNDQARETGLSVDQRAMLLDEIEKLHTAKGAATAIRPSAVVAQMLTCHQKLHFSVNNPGDKKARGELKKALDDLTAKVKGLELVVAIMKGVD